MMRFSVQALGFSFLALVAVGCGAPPAPTTTTTTTTATTTPAPAAVLPAGPSFYELAGSYEDQSGKKVSLDVGRGHPTLIAMFYARCPQACPMLIGEVNQVLKALSPEARSAVRVVLVSLDPATDTPAVLQEVMVTRTLDPQTFTLLRADEATTRGLATVMKVRYAGTDDGEIDHSSRIVLLDGAGVAIAEQDGLKKPLAGLMAAVERARSPTP
jgi:protein SCO1/2